MLPSVRTVRSFGTEGRRTGMQIPASIEVYDFITFKGDDIKDLEIHQGEPQQPQQPQYMQPQYMQPQYMQQPAYGYMAPPQQGYMGYPPQQQYMQPQYGAPAWGQPPAMPQQPPAQAPAPQQAQMPPQQPQQPPQAQAPPPQQQQKQPPQPKKSAWGNPNPPAAEGVILPAARGAAPAGGVAKTAGTVATPKPAAPKPKPTSFAAAALNAMAPEEVARLKAAPRPAASNVPAPRTGGAGGRGGRGGRGAPHPAGLSVPKEAFNFEKMLQKFNKEKLAQSAEAKKLSTEVQANPVYVKDDFFDTMSSEATEKANGNRARFHEQRRMDAMTFGFEAVNASHAQQRTAAAGRGGRGAGGRVAGGRGGRGGRR
jgi:protein LSM14